MAQLSILAEMMKKSEGQKHVSRQGHRGPTGSTGARPFKSRNPEAGYDKEVEMMNSPIFKAYMEKTYPTTPVLDALRSFYGSSPH